MLIGFSALAAFAVRENLSMYESAGKMVKQCAGLPLAIVVLGGILATKYELQDWERVGVSIKLSLRKVEQNGNDGVERVLESSYKDLPYCLKPCFLYFSQCKEDEEIKVTEMIQRWIGEGFIPSSIEEGDETMEHVAEGYLNELVSRCMVQVGRRGHTGRVKTCQMHDLMRDLCISKANEEGFAHTIDLRAENEGMNLEKASNRRLCILCGESRYKFGGSMLSSLKEVSPQLRSALFQDFDFKVGNDQLIAVGMMIKKLKLVRVLELPSFHIYSTTKTWRGHIGNLIHLRLLKLGFGIPKLPNLRCLQTLNLESCSNDLEISDSVWGMEQLRHLYLPRRGGGVCESSNQRASGLRNLQTLVSFPPKKFDLVKNLVKLTNVRKLTISSNWEDKDGILRNQEIMFGRLQSLTMWFNESYNDKYGDLKLQDITRSCPHLYRLVMSQRIDFPETAIATNSSIWPSNLTKLVLLGTKLDERHIRTVAKLQSLKALFLYFGAFIGKEMVFHKNDFPQLQCLIVQGLMELEVWSVREGALPSLFSLHIVYCKKLKSVSDGSQFLKHLKELRVRDMPLSFKRRLERDWDRVSQDEPCMSFSYVDKPELEKADDEIDPVEAKQ